MNSAIKSALAQQERLRKAFESPAMNTVIKSALAQQERLRKAFESPAMNTVIQNALAQRERLRKLFDSPAWRESLERVAEAYRRWDDDERRLLERLAPRGWVISPSTTLADLHELAALAEDQGVDVAEAALLAELTPARCRQIIEALYGRPSFAVWRTALDQALAAHEQGLYALSVPVWLIALDGIFFTELGVDGVFSRVHRKRGTALKRRLRPRGNERLVDALIVAIRTVAQHLPHGTELTPGELRRHAIFHGLDPNYGTEKASVQGILLLEVLHSQLEVFDAATDQAA